MRTVPAAELLRDVPRIPRGEFVAHYWRYQPGEHVTFLAPTGWGKTWFANDLLLHTCSSDLPAVVYATKPRDATMQRLIRAGFVKVTDWPVPVTSPARFKRPPGWVLWPKHNIDDVHADDLRHHRVFQRGLLHPYKMGARKNSKPSILVADEIYALSDLWLEREMRTVWTRGRSANCGLWGGSQRPANIPLDAYSQAAHLFLGNDPDKRSRDRFKEIGGVEPDLIVAGVSALRKHEWLYVRRDGPKLAIITRD